MARGRRVVKKSLLQGPGLCPRGQGSINEKGKLSDRTIKEECLMLERRVGPEPEIAHSRIPER